MEKNCVDQWFLCRVIETALDRLLPKYKGDLDVWVNAATVYQIAKISSSTLQTWRDNEYIRYAKISSKLILYYKPSIFSFIESKADQL